MGEKKGGWDSDRININGTRARGAKWIFMVQTKLVQSHQHRESRERKKKKQKQKHRERRNRPPPVERPKFPTRVAMHEVMQL